MTIICSHGFGVRSDSKGMFTQIADGLPHHTFTLFDYNIMHPNGDMEIPPLRDQAAKLQAAIDNTKDNDIVVLAHSQGCIIAGMADMSRVRKVILLAPPTAESIPFFMQALASRRGAEIHTSEMSRLPRRDGSSVLIPAGYAASIQSVNPLQMYQHIAATRPLTIVRASDDQTVGPTSFDAIRDATIIDIQSDHNFSHDARMRLVKTISDELDQA